MYLRENFPMDQFNKLWTRILLVLVLLLLVFLVFKSCKREPDYVLVPGKVPDSVFYWKNERDQAVASQKALKEQFSYENRRYLDSIARIYKTDAKAIQQLIVATIKGNTTLPPTTPGTSTDYDIIPGCPPVVKSMRDTFANTWNRVIVQLGQGRSLKLQSVDTITAMIKTVKEGNIFNRKTLTQVDLSNADTGRTITGMRVYIKPEKQKDLSLNIQGSLLYLDRKVYPMAGLGLERNTNRFIIGFGGGKEFLTNSYYGQANLKFKLAKFK